MAGLLVALNTILDDLVENFYQEYNDANVEIVTEEGLVIDIYIDDPETLYQALRNYVAGQANTSDIIDRMDNILPLDEGSFVWWISYPLTGDTYELYSFNSAEFVQGFISMCNAFNVDFRDYILGSPFKYVTQEPTYYQVEGYDIEPIPRPKREAPVGPFYTAQYEADPNAEDFM